MKTSIRIDGIRFTYSEGYLPTPRCRKLRYRDAKGETSAEVTLLTDPDTDAPVAFRFADRQLTQAMGHEYYGKDAHRDVKELRLFKGELYEREHNGTHCCGGLGWYNLDEFRRHLQSFDRRYSWELGRCPETLDDYTIAIQAAASSIVLMKHSEDEIGVWKPCGEPRYVFVTFGLGHNHGGTGLFIDQHYNENIPNSHYFNALHRDEAVQAAINAALRRGDDQSVESIKMCEEIEVLITDAVKVNPMRDHGEGDQFLNSLYGLTESTDSAVEAGLLVFCAAAKEIANKT